MRNRCLLRCHSGGGCRIDFTGADIFCLLPDLSPKEEEEEGEGEG